MTAFHCGAQEAQNVPKRQGKRQRCTSATTAEKVVRVTEPSAAPRQIYFPEFARRLLMQEDVSKIKTNTNPEPDVPLAVRLQLEYKLVARDEIHFLYIERAKFCMTRFMRDHTEVPHGSNNCIAVAVRANRFIRFDQVYVRCFCSDDVTAPKKLRSVADPVYRNGILELTEYNALPKKLLETKFGADSLVDAPIRRRAENIYKTHQVRAKVFLDSIALFTFLLEILVARCFDISARGRQTQLACRHCSTKNT